jgi:nucleotide-binding universal stress UspA family protein
MTTFNNIVLATDFSDSSINAYNYARHLAQHFGATLTVVHVYDMPISPETLDYLAVMPSPSDLERAVQERMSNFLGSHDGKVTTHIRIKTKALLGMGVPEDTLVEHSKNELTDLLIVGTKGGGNWIDKILGTVAIDVMQKAHCPVLLIPKEAKYTGIHQALFATSPDVHAEKNVRLALDFAQYFATKLHFIHVDAVFEDPKKDNSHEMFKRILAERGMFAPYSIESVTASTVSEGVNDYCLRNRMDLMIAVTHHRRFWDDLIHYSVTKEMAWHTHLPILCLHSDDEALKIKESALKFEHQLAESAI